MHAISKEAYGKSVEILNENAEINHKEEQESVDGRSVYINNQFIADTLPEPEEAQAMYQILKEQMEQALISPNYNEPIDVTYGKQEEIELEDSAIQPAAGSYSGAMEYEEDAEEENSNENNEDGSYYQEEVEQQEAEEEEEEDDNDDKQTSEYESERPDYVPMPSKQPDKPVLHSTQRPLATTTTTAYSTTSTSTSTTPQTMPSYEIASNPSTNNKPSKETTDKPAVPIRKPVRKVKPATPNENNAIYAEQPPKPMKVENSYQTPATAANPTKPKKSKRKPKPNRTSTKKPQIPQSINENYSQVLPPKPLKETLNIPENIFENNATQSLPLPDYSSSFVPKPSTTSLNTTRLAPNIPAPAESTAKPSSSPLSNALNFNGTIHKHKRRITFKTVSTASQFVSTPLADLMFKFSIGIAKPSGNTSKNDLNDGDTLACNSTNDCINSRNEPLANDGKRTTIAKKVLQGIFNLTKRDK